MNNIGITKAEYWLLDLVLDMWFPVAMLSEDVEHFLNRPNHGLSSSELVDALCKLFSEEYIVARKSDKKTMGRQLTLDKETLIELIIHKSRDDIFDFVYGLTEKGGLVWEQLSNADWNQYKYISLDTDENGNDVLLFSCTSPEVRDQFLYFYATYTERIPILGTTKIKTLEPFQVNYWKVLPVGYQISYSIAASYSGVDADNNAIWTFWNENLNNDNKRESWLLGKLWYRNYFLE